MSVIRGKLYYRTLGRITQRLQEFYFLAFPIWAAVSIKRLSLAGFSFEAPHCPLGLPCLSSVPVAGRYSDVNIVARRRMASGIEFEHGKGRIQQRNAAFSGISVPRKAQSRSLPGPPTPLGMKKMK